MFKLSFKCSKMGAVAAVFLLVAVAILPSMAQQTDFDLSEKQAPPQTFDQAYSPPKHVPMEQLFALGSSDEFSLEEHELMIDTVEAFLPPSEVLEKMSQEEIKAMWRMPGYFTPNQTSLNKEAEETEQTEQTGPTEITRAANPQPVKVVVIIDEDMWNRYRLEKPSATEQECIDWAAMWAYFILEDGDEILGNYGIDFQMVHYSTWVTPNSATYQDLLDTINGIDPRGIGDAVMILMSGQPSNMIQNGIVYGMAYGGTRHFVMNVITPGISNERMFAHEASHLYRCPDHTTSPAPACIMSYAYLPQNQLYCTPCNQTMSRYAFRLDHYYVSSAVGSTTYPVGVVFNTVGLTGSVPDGDVAYIRGLSNSGGGNIVGRLDKSVSNHAVHLYVGVFCDTPIYVYVSSDNYNWHQIAAKVVPYTGYMEWVNCGYYSGSFEYVAIAAINEGDGASINIDSVWVQSVA